MGWPARLLLALAVFLVFFAGLGAYPLIEPDEGRYTEIPREMLSGRDFVLPHLNGVLYLEKPPLYYWLNAAALTLPGRPEMLCRLAGAIFGLAGVGLAWALGRSIGGPRVARVSGLVLGSSPLWVALSRSTIIDMTLTFFLSATLTCFWLAQERGERGTGADLDSELPHPRPSSPRPSSPAPSPPPSPGEKGERQDHSNRVPLSRGGGWEGAGEGTGVRALGRGRSEARAKLAPTGERGERLLWYGMFASAALATLAKGLIGFVIPGAVIFFHLLFARRWRRLLRVPWVSGILLFLAIAAPWHVLAARRSPDFLWFYFVHEHLQRYATSEAKRQAPFWFFAAILAIGLLPWSGVLPAAARLFQRKTGRLRDRPGLIFLACWAGFVFVFFSVSQSKLVPYILPAIPPLAVLIAVALAAAEEDERLRSWARAGGAVGALLLAVLAAALLWVSFGRVREVSTDVVPSLLVLAVPTLALCLLSAWLWRRGSLRSLPSLGALAAGPVLLVICLVSLGPRAAQRLSAEPIARVLAGRLAPGDEVYAYRCYPQTLPFYLQRLVGLVEYQGELAFGIQHLAPEERARRFPGAAQFQPVWASGRTVYLVLEAEKLPRMQSDGLAPGLILMRQEKYLLMTNRPPSPRSAG
ncbi:MAG: glycosyltransferase family 39 protein [Acidobacteria bacterium]|nr:glycosyltransferase family 39 protein [Acidobacteriota bacterium]